MAKKKKPEADVEAEAARKANILRGAGPEDFLCHGPTNTFIYRPTGDFWRVGTINGRFDSEEGGRMSDYMAQHQCVEQATWWPGQPQVIKDKLMVEGEMVERPGVRVFNLYRPPTITGGDANL